VGVGHLDIENEWCMAEEVKAPLSILDFCESDRMDFGCHKSEPFLPFVKEPLSQAAHCK